MTELEIFEAARKLTDPVARAAYVEQQCGDNAELRASVLSLLEISDQTCEFDPPPEIPSPEPVDSGVASTIIPPGGGSPPSSSGPQPPEDSGDFIGRVINGRYKLLEEIGEGGQGTVYKAEDLTFHRGDNDQLRKYNRYVAVKLIRTSMNGDKVLQRFLAERQALAMMDHPHIAKFLDAGHTSQDGVYFVMELVKGLPIAKYCDLHQLTLDDRLKLVIQVSKAIQHAHQKGVIHRDLKPGNILVAEYDGKPSVKVIDFGLAKALGEPLTDDSVNTGFFGVAGTIQYMAPEQATFNQLDIDTRADVYSMTVVLYELLTGSTPHSAQELKLAGVLEQLRMVREEDPPKASNRLSSSAELPSLAAYRQAEPRKLIGILRRELDAVLMKGLEKDRDRRYESPNDFADDLERFLNREPVKAVPPSIAYRTSKYIRKHWKPLLVAVVLLTSVVGGLAGMSWQEYRRAEIAYQKELSDLKAKDEEQKRELSEAREKATRREADLTHERAASRIQEAAASEYVGLIGQVAKEEQQRTAGWTRRSLKLIEQAALLPTPLRDFSELRTAAATVLAGADVIPDPEWEFNKGEIAATPNEGDPGTISYSPSGKYLAVGLNATFLAPNPTVLLLDTRSGKVVHRLVAQESALPFAFGGTVVPARTSARSVHFGIDDTVLFVGTRRGRLYRWDLTGKTPTSRSAEVSNGGVTVRTTPDGRYCITYAATAEHDFRVRCWDAKTLKNVSDNSSFKALIDSIAIAPDSSRLIANCKTNSYQLIIPDLTVEKVLPGQFDCIFHPSGRRVISTGNGSLKVSRDSSIEPEFMYSGAKGFVLGQELTMPRISPDGEILACLNRTSNHVGFWRFGHTQPCAVLRRPSNTNVNEIAFSPNGEHVAIKTETGVAQFRIEALTAAHSQLPQGKAALQVCVAPDGNEIAVDLTKTAFDQADRTVRRMFIHGGTLTGNKDEYCGVRFYRSQHDLSYSPDGRWLVTTGDYQPGKSSLVVMDRRGGRVPRRIVMQEEVTGGVSSFTSKNCTGIGWTRDGYLIVAASTRLLVWDLSPETPEPLGSIATSEPISYYAALSMSGDAGCAITKSGTVQTLSFAGRKLEIVGDPYRITEGTATALASQAAHRLIAVGNNTGTVSIADPTNGNVLHSNELTHSDQITEIVWYGPARMITGSRDGTIAFWRVTHKELSVQYRVPFSSSVTDLSASTDGKKLYVTCSGDESVHVFDLAEIDSQFATLGIDEQESNEAVAGGSTKDATSGTSRARRAADRAKKLEIPEPTIDYTAEREAAEWVLSIGGTVTIVRHDGREIPYEEGPLPQQNYLVRAVHIDGARRFSNVDLVKLRTCRALVSLDLSNLPSLTDDGIAALEGCEIRSLFIGSCPALTDKLARSLAKLSRLESLRLHAGSLTDECLSHLGPLKSLSKVMIAEPGITNAGLAKLAAACPQISFLDISSAPRQSTTGVALASFRNLTEARINGPQFTDEAVQSINAIAALTTLHLVHSVSDDNIRQLGGLSGVTSLFVQSHLPDDRTAISPTIYTEAMWPPALVRLYFVGSKVAPQNADFIHLAELSQLRVLGLNCRQTEPRYTPAGLARFRRLRPNVLLTDEGGPPVTAAINYAEEREAAEWVLSVGGTLALKDTAGNPLPFADGRLPEASFVVDACGFRSNVHDFANADLSKLAACRKLTALHFIGLAELTDEGISSLRGLRVRELMLINCPLLTDKSLASIARFYEVESLHAQNVAFTDAGIAALKPLDTLRDISVATTQITDEGLLRLAIACPGIAVIHIHQSRNEQQTVRGVARFQKLTQLYINGYQFSEEAVDVVNSIPTLKSVTIISPMDDATIARVRKLKTVHTLGLASNGNEASAQLSATFLSDIAWPKCIQNFYLSGGAVSPRDEDLLHLAKLQDLKGIGVGGAKEPLHPQRWTHAGFLKLRELRPDIYIGMDQLFYAAGTPLPLTPPQDQSPGLK